MTVSYIARSISEHGMFPLVYVQVRQQAGWKLHPYNSIAPICIFPFIKILLIWPSLEKVVTNLAVMMFVLL